MSSQLKPLQKKDDLRRSLENDKGGETSSERKNLVERPALHFLVRLWHQLCGRSARDIDRLQEAGVQLVEAKKDKVVAEMREKLAEAELKLAEANKSNAEAYATRVTAKADSIEKIVNAILAMKKAGGSIDVDIEDFKKLLDERDFQ